LSKKVQTVFQIGDRILFWLSAFMSIGFLSAITYLAFDETTELRLLTIGFMVSMLIHWAFYLFHKVSAILNKYTVHLTALLSFLLFSFVTVYNPLHYSEMWVYLLFYPLTVALLNNRSVFKVWTGVFLIFYFGFMLWDPTSSLEEGFGLSLIGRTLYAIASCLIGFYFLEYQELAHQKMQKELLEEHNSRLVKTLYTLVPVVERKSHTSREVINRAADLMKKVSKQLPDHKIEDWEIELISLLHFVSRIKYPDYLFEKQDKLTQFEFNLVQEHCELGCELLGEDEAFSSIKEAFRHHHEKLDGTGYPHQLAGNRIPIFAQILGITEAYLAMITPRSYRKALSNYETFMEISKLSNLAYDERVVKAMGEALGLSRIEQTNSNLVG
jgi:hypothetical protein